MNSASQSESSRELLGDLTRLSREGWRRASPAWFPLLVASITVLASVPVALLLGQANGAAGYWLVAGPVSAAVSGWFFGTRRVQPPFRVGLVVLAAGSAMLLLVLGFVVLGLVWWGGAAVAPWLAVGAGFGIFAAAWRSVPTAVFAGVTVLVALGVGVVAPVAGDLLLVAVVGVTAGVAAIVDLVRADGRPA